MRESGVNAAPTLLRSASFAKLQLRTLGELTMRTLHLERELCARLLCSREAAASLRRPSVGLSASARGAKSRRRHFHLWGGSVRAMVILARSRTCLCASIILLIGSLR